MEKKLFIYYSFTGNGDFVAEKMKEKGFEIRKIEEDYKMPKSFFWKVMKGGMRAGMGIKGKLKEFDANIEGYDDIVIGSPIWNGRFPPAINGLLDKIDFRDIDVTFLFYSGSGEGKKAEQKVLKEYKKASIIFTQDPKKHPEELNKIKGL